MFGGFNSTPPVYKYNPNIQENITIDISNKTDECCFYLTLPITFPYYIVKEICKYANKKK